MTMFVRLTIVCGLFLGSMASVAFAFPSFATENGLDFWNVGEYEDALDNCRRTTQEMERTGRHICNRIHIKSDLIVDLVANRTTFRDVVLQFWTLNNQHPPLMNIIRSSFTGQTDMEKQCQNVIGYVRAHLETNPSVQAEWERKLEGEMKILLEDTEFNVP